ncbi:uncharacterized protein [Henckelia pumila]|uniref:uncharacterized protein n=1 Tax=Henckelia pumila TaxID=405737 RepID=UPI003C6DE87C
MHSGNSLVGICSPVDSLDEYVCMGERTALNCLIKFCLCMIDVFGARDADTQRLLQMHEKKHDFPGMLGSLDCMHWEWRNYHVARKGQYTRGYYGVPTIILEAVASTGKAPNVHFMVNKTSYTKGYYLTDGIYSEWVAFIKNFPCPEDPKRKKFKERQESGRKDVERAFGKLQARWKIVRGPALSYYKNDLRNIM